MLVDAGLVKTGYRPNEHQSRLLFYIPDDEAVELLSHFRKEDDAETDRE